MKTKKNFDMDLAVFDDVANTCNAVAKASLEIKVDIMEVSKLMGRIFTNFDKVSQYEVSNFDGTNERITEQLKVLKNWFDRYFKDMGVDNE